jgi:hypothetical protein
MNRVVLDASALLAILNQEPGAERLTPELLSAAATSTVDLAEVHGKLVGRGLDPDDAWEATLSPILEAVAFSSEHAQTYRPFGCTNPRAWLFVGGPGLFRTRARSEGAGIHGRQDLEETENQCSHQRRPVIVIVPTGRAATEAFASPHRHLGGHGAVGPYGAGGYTSIRRTGTCKQ